MARGTVKDPQGHQSRSYDFGYIQRKGGDNWPDEQGRKKAIPFFNGKDHGKRIFPKTKVDVEFEVREAVVYLETDAEGNPLKNRIEVGTIGIAYEVKEDKEV